MGSCGSRVASWLHVSIGTSVLSALRKHRTDRLTTAADRPHSVGQVTASSAQEKVHTGVAAQEQALPAGQLAGRTGGGRCASQTSSATTQPHPAGHSSVPSVIGFMSQVGRLAAV